MSNTLPTPKALAQLKPYGPLELGGKFHYVTVHWPEPDSANPAELKHIGIVDLYWAYEDDAFFVSIVRDPDLHTSSRFNPRTGELKGDFFVTVRTGPISVQRIDTILSSLADWIEGGGDLESTADGIID